MLCNELGSNKNVSGWLPGPVSVGADVAGHHWPWSSCPCMFSVCVVVSSLKMLVIIFRIFFFVKIFSFFFSFLMSRTHDTRHIRHGIEGAKIDLF